MKTLSPQLKKKLTEYLSIKQETGLIPYYLWSSPSHSQPISPQESPMSKKSQTSSPPSKSERLSDLKEKMKEDTRCKLFEGSTQLVFGVGNPDAGLMFVGEAPGRDEDLKGEPFVGRAGQLLTKIIEAMGMKREEVYISNVVKSRPPENRTPTPHEMQVWAPFLFEEILIVRPKILVALGNVAVQSLIASEKTITTLRGHLHRWPSQTLKAIEGHEIEPESILLMPTYHPAYLLRNPNMKKPVWDDMKIVMEELKK